MFALLEASVKLSSVVQGYCETANLIGCIEVDTFAFAAPSRTYLSTAVSSLRLSHYSPSISPPKTSALSRQQAITMRFTIGATAALAAAVVRAEEPAAESSSTSVAKPTFTVCDLMDTLVTYC